jgi:hypothetical protein
MPALAKPTNGSNADYPARVGALFDAFNNGNYNFPATQVPSADPNTLDDYEEGTWTPSDASGAGLTFTSVGGKYVKVGSVVHAWGVLVYPSTSNGAAASVGGLPFTVANDQQSRAGGLIGYSTVSTAVYFIPLNNATVGQLFTSAGLNVTNAAFSLATLYMSATYPV